MGLRLHRVPWYGMFHNALHVLQIKTSLFIFSSRLLRDASTMHHKCDYILKYQLKHKVSADWGMKENGIWSKSIIHCSKYSFGTQLISHFGRLSLSSKINVDFQMRIWFNHSIDLFQFVDQSYYQINLINTLNVYNKYLNRFEHQNSVVARKRQRKWKWGVFNHIYGYLVKSLLCKYPTTTRQKHFREY